VLRDAGAGDGPGLLGTRTRMKANFYPELTLRDDRRRVDASGPLNWDEIPVEVARVAVVAVVSQDGVRGRGSSREYRREDRDREWWCEVELESGDAFGPGPAPCAGTLYATWPDGLAPWPWVGDPELVEGWR
jgi:hypothetical protein